LKKQKRLLIITITSLLVISIVIAAYWQVKPENTKLSPTPYPTPTPPQQTSTQSPLPTTTPSPYPSAPIPSPSTSPPIDLNPEEIREYEGENLGSVNSFRENSIKGPQNIDQTTYRLKVKGLVNESKEYSYDEVLSGFNSHRKIVTIYCVEGWSVKILWEGFLLKDLLGEVGVKPGAVAVIFYAYDGYSTALPLDYLLDNDIMIAYKMNNVTLPPERGFPFQLVAESKLGYKWIKWITEIEVSDNPDYLGFWESRGYPNDANLP
jgi:DMSO/TMAO reductase YedYZ molybdopterin-dependent catalytic subunit